MITSLKVGDKFTVPEKFELGWAVFEPDVVYTVVGDLAENGGAKYSVEPGHGWNDKWYFDLKGERGEPVYNIFEPYPAEETSIGDRLKDALEILESAGPAPKFVVDGTPEAFEVLAREYLQRAIHAQKVREAKEAEEKELEELALNLMNTNSKISGRPVVSSWSEVEFSSTKVRWLDVAKEAKKFFSDK